MKKSMVIAVLGSWAMAAVYGEQLRLAGTTIRAEVDSATGATALYRGEAQKPFAEFRLPGRIEQKQGTIEADGATTRTTLTTYRDFPFLLLTLTPKTDGHFQEKTARLPEITLAEAYAPAGMRALGTAGLTTVDGHSGSYMFLALARPGTRDGVVAAWLTSLHASGIVFSGCSADASRTIIRAEAQYGRVPCTGSDQVETFVIGAFEDCRLGLESYADLIAARFDIHLPPPIAGYCTWYADRFGGAGTEASTREFANVAAAKLIPYGFSFFQIDDQWQLGASKNGPHKNFTAHNPKGPYPSGMKATADYLKSKGIRAGLWFMPFSGNADDPYYADKQDWFVKSAIDYPAPGQKNTRHYHIDQHKGAPYETFWGGTCLDMTDAKVQQYLDREISQISQTWGYRYFKYDGMWTGMACEQLYVNDGYLPDDMGEQIFDNPRVTNVEAYRDGVKRLRAAGGKDVFILACNLSQNMRTMGASYGLVDAMRIGPDNGPSWAGVCRGPIRGTARYFYNGRVWYNDPDPVYVRDSIPLARAELITSWAAISGAFYAFSDWLPGLSEKRVNVLQKTIAPCPGTRRPEDLFERPLARIWHYSAGEHHVLGLFNWDEKQDWTATNTVAALGLDPHARYAGYDFWADTFVPTFTGALNLPVTAASCRMVALQALKDRPVLVSTSRHVLSPAFDVREENWDAKSQTLTGYSRVVAGDRYELRFVLPPGFAVKSADLAGAQDIHMQAEGANLRVSGLPTAGGELAWKLLFRADH